VEGHFYVYSAISIPRTEAFKEINFSAKQPLFHDTNSYDSRPVDGQGLVGFDIVPWSESSDQRIGDCPKSYLIK
jgi:hypothetical protein